MYGTLASDRPLSSDGRAELTHTLDTGANYAAALRSESGGFAILERMFNNVFRFWNDSGERPISPVTVNSPRVLSLDYSPSDECIVTASPNGEIVSIDPRDGEEVCVFRIDKPLWHIKFMDGCDRLVASTMDGKVYHWEY